MASPTALAPCGTVSAYKRHKRKKEQVDAACLAANAAYAVQYRRASGRARNRPPRRPGPINHGTRSGYTQHRRRGERACASCLDACRLYATKERRAKGIKPKAVRAVYKPPVVEVGPACAHPDVDPDWFFPVDEFDRPDLTAKERKSLTTQGYRKARKVCASCPIQQQCLAENLDPEYGIFGGQGPWQREQLRLRDTRAADAVSFFDGNVTS